MYSGDDGRAKTTASNDASVEHRAGEDGGEPGLGDGEHRKVAEITQIRVLHVSVRPVAGGRASAGRILSRPWRHSSTPIVQAAAGGDVKGAAWK